MSDTALSCSERVDESTVLFASTVDMSNIFYDGIIQKLAQRKCDIHVVSSTGTVGNALFGQDAKIHHLEMERGLSPLRDLKSLIRWLRLLSRVKPRIVIIGTPKASLLGGIAARLMRTPRIIYIIHGLRSENTRGLMAVMLTAVESLTLRTAHQIIAVSESLRNTVVQAHPKYENRIDVLEYGSVNGVQMSRFTLTKQDTRKLAREKWLLPEKHFNGGFVGRLHRDKGGDFLIQLMKHERGLRLNLHLLIIGDIEDETLRPEIEELSREGRVTVTGWMSEPEVALPALDLLLHPTRREGLGMSLLEAQAAGIPVLTNEVTGTIDAVENGVGGRFAEIDSLESWLYHIEVLASDANIRQQMGQKGRQFVIERYEREKVVGKFIDYLDCSPQLDGKSKNLD